MKNQNNLYSYAPGSRPKFPCILTFNNYQSIMLATLYQQPSFNNPLMKYAEKYEMLIKNTVLFSCLK